MISNEGYGDLSPQRFFCTDSGAVGWYNSSGHENAAIATVTYLMNTSFINLVSLASDDYVNKFIFITSSSVYGPSTVAVAGDTLFYYSYRRATASSEYSLPRLSFVVFHEYVQDVPFFDLII